MRALLVESDSATAQTIESMLKPKCFNVWTTHLGEEGIDLAKIYDYDIIVLTLNLPDMSGFEVLRTLRASKVKTPIIILTELAGIEDKVRGLNCGADDYMTKPFHKDELVARIHAVVRRTKGHARSVIEIGKLSIDLDGKSVTLAGQHLHLSIKQYKVLELFALRKGTIITRELMMDHVYGGMDEPQIRILDALVYHLRKKIISVDPRPYINTVMARGYVLRDPDEPKPTHTDSFACGIEDHSSVGQVAAE